MKFKTLIPALLCASGLATAKSPVETYGALSVKNAKVVDQTGSPVTLRGMSLFWHMDMGGKEFWNPSVVSYTQVNWHNTVIRAPVGIEDRTTSNGTKIPGYISNPTDAMMKLHAMIDAAILYGSYIIVDWHTEQMHESEAKAFFGELAKEYGSTPNIIWEIYNEPNGPGWGQIAAYAKTVITEIRKYSDNLVLVGNSSWDQHPDEAGTELDGFKNIAYTVHFYSNHTHWGTMTGATAKGHAVFASEWGMSGSSGDGGFVDVNSGNIKTWLDNMNSQGVSHCNWSLGNPNGGRGTSVPSETSAALTQTATYTPKIDGIGWADADLTASGKSIKGYLVTKNPAWTLSDTTTKIIKPLSITSSKTADLVMGKDTVTFGATFSKAAAWSLALTAPSGAKRSYSGQGVNLVINHPVNAISLGTTTKWALGETVTATLTPGGSKATYVLSTSSMTGPRLTPMREIRINWDRTRIIIPDGLINPSVQVRVMIRNAQGQVVWQKSGTMGTYRSIEMGETAPRLSGVNFLEVHSSDAILRSTLAPSL